MIRKTRLLIIDDHEKVRVELVSKLQRAPDLQIVGNCGGADEAVKLARDLQPDLVLLDVKMADKNGLQTCRRIAQASPKARILILTSYPDQEEKDGAYRAGARGYELKDIDSEGLIRRIRSALNEKLVSH